MDQWIFESSKCVIVKITEEVGVRANRVQGSQMRRGNPTFCRHTTSFSEVAEQRIRRIATSGEWE